MAQELMNRGYKSVHPLYGGYDAWVEAGGPVEPK
jgi:rhodanese-related sulfurtransferase